MDQWIYVVGRAWVCQLDDLECCLGSHTLKWPVGVVFIATNQIVALEKAAGDGCTGLSGAPIDQQLLQRLQNWMVAINTTPTGHFKVWESKQHSKSSSWHTQALPTTYIHWYILYTRSSPLQPTQVPQKRERAIESYSIEFSPSALWDTLRDSVCFILVFICAWSFDSHSNFLQSVGGL